MRGVTGSWTHSVSGYINYRCRCGVCREAWRVYHLDYMHRHPEQMKKNAERGRQRRKQRVQS